ncbi:hypothetical protein F4823DRAFT_619257 [Ustulina deusta]|nr:hypothetical protein F4823DRAFT_619257 [Ustulina deusta]
MTHSSLARLDEVSRHHYISKGIRAIKLSLFPVYDSVLAHDIRAFAMYHLSDLRQGIESWHEALDWLPNGGTSVEVCQRAITRAVSLAESWEELAARGVDASRADHLMISQAHEQYLQRYEDYDRLSCSLTQIITSAMGRMPTATWIKIYDPNIYKPPRWTPRVLDQPDSLLNCLLLPVGWSDVRQRRLGWLAPPPSHPICELLLSIQQLGISLVGLDIETPPPVPSSSASNMAITHDPTVFHHAVKRLKAVSFNLRDIWGKYWTGRAPEEWAYLTSFLLSLLHTDSLRKISLNFNFMRTDDPRSLLSMAPLLLSYTWPNLQHLYFNGPFHFEELKAAVKPLGQNAKLQWCGYLMSGSWADVLDFLRERNGPKQELGDQNGSIYGQECDRMSEDERNFIFWNDLRFHLTSRATDYIRRCLASNPVRDWEMVN